MLVDLPPSLGKMSHEDVTLSCLFSLHQGTFRTATQPGSGEGGQSEVRSKLGSGSGEIFRVFTISITPNIKYIDNLIRRFLMTLIGSDDCNLLQS